MYRLHSYCSYCGQPFAPTQSWPRICAFCNSTTYRNPLPVVIALVPVDDGLLMIRRGSMPRQGQLALPGGFIEMAERWQDAAVRELREETSVELSSETISDFGTRSTPDGYLLVFGLGPHLRSVDLPSFRPSREASERVILTAPAELAFPLHTEAVVRFFDLRGRFRSPS